jgi:hypothetical protein
MSAWNIVFTEGTILEGELSPAFKEVQRDWITLDFDR